MRIRTYFSVLVFLLSFTIAGCDDGGGGQASGTVTLSADEGVDLVSGQVQSPGNFANSDLFASSNGTALQLSTGGDNPTVNRPVTWFRTAGGIYPTFGSLDEVPDIRPDDSMTQSLIRAETGHAFVVQNADGSYTRGWLQNADATSVTIVFVPSVSEFE